MVRDFFIYGVGAAASRLAAVFLVPLYTRFLSQAEYGQLEVLLAIHTLAVLGVGLQSESAILRDFYAARDKGELPQLSWGGIALTALGAAAVIPATYLAAALGWFDRELIPFIPAVLGLTLLAQILGIQLLMVRFAGSPLRFGILSFCDLTVSALASVALIVGAGWGIWGAIGGMATGKLVALILAWPSTFGWPPVPYPSRALLRRMLAYSLPTMPSVLLNWLQNNGIRIILAVFLPFADIAIASVGLRVAALYGFVIYSFRLAWEPWAFRMLDDPDRSPRAYGDILRMYSFGMLLIGCAATAVSPLLVDLFAPSQYASATALVGFFMMAQYWGGIANIAVIGVHGARATSRLTWIFGVGGLVNVGLTALLVPSLGVAAAGIATIAGSVATAWAAAWWSERLFATGFSYRLLAAASVVTGGIAGVAFWSFADLSTTGFGTSEAMLVASAGSMALCLLFWMTGFNKDERGGMLVAARDSIGRGLALIKSRQSAKGHER